MKGLLKTLRGNGSRCGANGEASFG